MRIYLTWWYECRVLMIRWYNASEQDKWIFAKNLLIWLYSQIKIILVKLPCYNYKQKLPNMVNEGFFKFSCHKFAFHEIVFLFHHHKIYYLLACYWNPLSIKLIVYNLTSFCIFLLLGLGSVIIFISWLGLRLPSSVCAMRGPPFTHLWSW